MISPILEGTLNHEANYYSAFGSRLLTNLTQEDDAQEIDCSDETVYTALKKYNAGLQSGNQFVLYQPTEGTKTVSDSFLVKPLVIGALGHRGRRLQMASP